MGRVWNVHKEIVMFAWLTYSGGKEETWINRETSKSKERKIFFYIAENETERLVSKQWENKVWRHRWAKPKNERERKRVSDCAGMFLNLFLFSHAWSMCAHTVTCGGSHRQSESGDRGGAVCGSVCVSTREGEIERLRWNDSVWLDTVLPIRHLFTFLE